MQPYTNARRRATIRRMITRRLRIEGLVQGVGYRAAMRDRAQRLGVTGWVRNRRDGGVEAVAQGPAEALERFVAWARQGPPAARVASVRVSDAGEETERFLRFEQLPSV
jgi:acylphosphatase